MAMYCPLSFSEYIWRMQSFLNIYNIMEIFNKSTMPVNAEKYFMTHHGIRTHDLGNIA